MRLLQRYPYPGNIRELEGIIQRAIILARENCVSASDLPPEVTASVRVTATSAAASQRIVPLARTNDELKKVREEASSLAVSEVEKAFLEAALEDAGGNITKASANTGMNRSLFQRLVKKHDLLPSRYKKRK